MPRTSEPSIHDLPTTQKAAMNAVMRGIGVEPRGARHLALDNRYQCPELAALLLTKCNVYSNGTVRKNRKGWDKKLMNLTPKSDRGTCKLSADKINRVLAAQWVDSKVVNVVSSYCDTSIGTVFPRVGQSRKEVPCPCTLKKYQQTMFGVDKGDRSNESTGMRLCVEGTLPEMVQETVPSHLGLHVVVCRCRMEPDSKRKSNTRQARVEASPVHDVGCAVNDGLRGP
jgi:hypothetical protein